MNLNPAELSPARKAWVTRRAKLAAETTPIGATNASVVIAKPVVVNVSTDAALCVRYVAPPELEPVTELRVVDIWLDDPVVGCGDRRFIVLDMSSREVRLFYVPGLLTTTVHRQTFDEQHRPARRPKRQVIADTIRRNIARADRVNGDACKVVLADGGAEAQRALALLQVH